MLLRRTLQASNFRWQNFSTSNAVLSKAKKPSPLAELRKKSGYSLTLCKDALAKNENDVAKAFQWLDVSCMPRVNLNKNEWLVSHYRSIKVCMYYLLTNSRGLQSASIKIPSFQKQLYFTTLTLRCTCTK